MNLATCIMIVDKMKNLITVLGLLIRLQVRLDASAMLMAQLRSQEHPVQRVEEKERGYGKLQSKISVQHEYILYKFL